MALALENAVALVLSPSGLLLGAALEGARAIRGFLRTFFEMRQLLPVLPDPYVASFDKAIQTPGVLIAQVGWDSPPDPRLTVDVQVVNPNLAEPIVAAVATPTFELIDVSSHVDQLGVSWSPKGPADIVAQQLALAGTGQVLSLFTLSEILVGTDVFGGSDPGGGNRRHPLRRQCGEHRAHAHPAETAARRADSRGGPGWRRGHDRHGAALRADCHHRQSRRADDRHGVFVRPQSAGIFAGGGPADRRSSSHYRTAEPRGSRRAVSWSDGGGRACTARRCSARTSPPF